MQHVFSLKINKIIGGLFSLAQGKLVQEHNVDQRFSETPRKNHVFGDKTHPMRTSSKLKFALFNRCPDAVFDADHNGGFIFLFLWDFRSEKLGILRGYENTLEA